MAYLAGRHGFGHRTPGLLHRHFRVYPVQLVEVHVVGAEPAQAVVDRLPNVLGTAVVDDDRGVVGTAGRVAHDQADLGGQHRAPAVAPGQGPADKLLVGLGPVDVSGVDKAHAAVERGPDHGDGGVVVARGSHVVGEGHTVCFARSVSSPRLDRS